MKRTSALGVVAWSGAPGVLPVNLRPMPDNIGIDSLRVTHLLLDFRFDLTTLAETGAITVDQLLGFIQNIAIEVSGTPLVNISGLDLFRFMQYLSQEFLDTPPVVGAAETNIIVHAFLWIPFEGMRSYEPQDYVLPAAVFNGSNMNVTLGGEDIGTDGTVNACTLTTTAMLERKNEVQIPALPLIMGKDIEIEDDLGAGIYKELFICAPPACFTNAADLTLIKVSGYDEAIHKGVTTEQVIRAHNADRLLNNDYLARGATPDDWENDAALFDIVPLLWPGYANESNRIGQYIDTMGQRLQIECIGNLTDIHVVFRLYRRLNQSQSEAQLIEMKANDPGQLVGKRKTASKVDMPTDAIRTSRGMGALPIKIEGELMSGALGPLVTRFIGKKKIRSTKTRRR